MRNKHYLIIGILILTAVYLRYISLPYTYSDFTIYLKPWSEHLSNNGLAAFSQPFSNYPPTYLYLLLLLTHINGNLLILIKLLSFVSDFLIALVATQIVKALKPGINKIILYYLFCLIILLPTVIFNSSLMSQSDAIYVFFALSSLLSVIKNRPVLATLFFGLSFIFKLQSIFWLPILIGYLWRNNKIYLLLLLPIIFIIPIIPVYITGGQWIYYLGIYFVQMGYYAKLFIAAPSIYALIPPITIGSPLYLFLTIMGIGIAFLASILVIRWMKSTPKLTTNKIMASSILISTTIPFVLPHMHERYYYIAEILIVIYAVVNKQYRPYAAALIIISTCSYLLVLNDTRVGFGLLSIGVGFLLYKLFKINKMTFSVQR